MNIFIDNNDLEEQYGEQKYQEYLEKENKQMKQDITTMNNEIERLNNIINELENTLQQLIFESDNHNHKLTAQIILMRLKELKEINND